MPLCRVFQYPDGSVGVMCPNSRLRTLGETDVAFVNRICTADALKEPTVDANGNPLPGPFLKDVPFTDVDAAILPMRTRVDAQGDDCPCRNSWRWDSVNSTVVVDETKVQPNWAPLFSRLAQVIPLAKHDRLLKFLSEVGIAAAMRNPGGVTGPVLDGLRTRIFQKAYDTLKVAMQSTTPPLTTKEFGAVKLTITEKRIPITL